MSEDRSVFFDKTSSLKERTQWYSGFECDSFMPLHEIVTGRLVALQQRHQEDPIHSMLCIGPGDGAEFMGLYGSRFTTHPRRVVAVEPCKAFVKHMREWELIQEPDGFEIAECGIEDFESTERFQVVTFFELIEHFTQEEIPAILSKAWSFVEEGGELWVSTPDALGEFGWSNDDPSHLHVYQREELLELIQSVTQMAPSLPETSPFDPILLVKVTR